MDEPATAGERHRARGITHRDPTDNPSSSDELRRGAGRWLWFTGGWLAVGLGGVGVVVPGLPTTVFFIVAASCFARCSPRFERWVLELPGVGPAVRDHRAGLGMPRRAKVAAVTAIVVASTASIVLTVRSPMVAGAIAALAVVGVWYVSRRVPTRERVLAARAAAGTPAPG